MLEYESKYIRHLQSQGYSKNAIYCKKRALRLFEMFLEENNIPADPRMWNQNVIEDFFVYLKTFTYKIADNWKTGYIKDKAGRKYITRQLCEEVRMMYMGSLKYFLRYLMEQNKIYADPFEKIEIRPQYKRKRKQDVTESDIQKLVSAIDSFTYLGYRNRAIIELIYGTGLRLSEVSKLDEDDIDFKESILLIRGKGKKERLVPFGEVVKGYLKEYMTEVRKYLVSINKINERALFLNNRGDRLPGGSITRIIKDSARKAKLPHIKTHKLRHAFSLHMLRKGCDIRYIQEILGHKNLKTTTVYTEIYDRDLKDKISGYHPNSKQKKAGFLIRKMKEISKKF